MPPQGEPTGEPFGAPCWRSWKGYEREPDAATGFEATLYSDASITGWSAYTSVGPYSLFNMEANRFLRGYSNGRRTGPLCPVLGVPHGRCHRPATRRPRATPGTRVRDRAACASPAR
jgi:hypothetical protein